MTDDDKARLLAFADALTRKDGTTRRLRVLRCDCRTIIATAHAWSDGRRYLWIPGHPMRIAGTGRFAPVAPVVVGLDDGDHWQTATICKCGNGTILSCHGTNAAEYPEGVVAVRFSTGEADSGFQVGEAVATWSLKGTTDKAVLPGLMARQLGRATTATVAP